MKEIYSSGMLTVTKSPVTGEYTFHGNRVPLLRTTLEGALALAHAILKEDGWISVKDRLPEEDGCYLVATGFHSNRVRMTSYKKIADYPWAYPWAWFKEGEVTHWMPLPEPPKEDE